MNDILKTYDLCRTSLSDLTDEGIGSGSGWACFTKKSVIIKHDSLPSLDALSGRLTTILSGRDACRGWTLWQREIGLEVVSAHDLMERLRNQQAPLDAELGDETASIALVYRNAAWHLTWVREDGAEGHPVLACDQTYLGRSPAPGRLRYRVYWKHDQHGYRPRLARFMGFASDKS